MELNPHNKIIALLNDPEQDLGHLEPEQFHQLFDAVFESSQALPWGVKHKTVAEQSEFAYVGPFLCSTASLNTNGWLTLCRTAPQQPTDMMGRHLLFHSEHFRDDLPATRSAVLGQGRTVNIEALLSNPELQAGLEEILLGVQRDIRAA